MQRTFLATMATTSALALLLATAPLADDVEPSAAGEAGAVQPIEGEALADDPAHGMGEGDDAVGGGVSTHTLEGERGYASLEGEERQAAQLDPELGDWTIEELLGAATVDGEGQALGGIEDLIVDEDDRIRKVVLPLDGEAGTFVMVPIEELSRAEGDAGGELVLAGDLAASDHERVRRQDERWLPQDDE